MGRALQIQRSKVFSGFGYLQVRLYLLGGGVFEATIVYTHF